MEEEDKKEEEDSKRNGSKIYFLLSNYSGLGFVLSVLFVSTYLITVIKYHTNSNTFLELKTKAIKRFGTLRRQI
jgi:hypothetical protein